MKVNEALAAELEAAGIDAIFTLIGDESAEFVAHAVRRGTRLFTTRHETGTVGVGTDQSPVTAHQTSRNPAAAASQPKPANARQRSKFHAGLGLGGGAMDFACDGCNVASETGFSGFLSLAGSVSEKTLLGVESTGWTKNESGTTAQVYSLMANVTQYLSATSGFFLSTGVGLVGYREDRDAGDFSARAAGFSGRLGYEFGTGRVVFLPYAGFVRTFGGADMKLDGRNAGLNVAISNAQFGLSIAVR